MSYPTRQSAGSIQSQGQTNKLRKPLPTESRTMALARGMSGDPAGSSPALRIASRRTLSTTTTPASSTSVTTSTRTRTLQLRTSSTLAAVSKPTLYGAIYDYFRHSVKTALHPVSALEHYWALRAARAEILLGAHQVHAQQLAAAYATHEERRSRDLAEINERYAREYAHIRRMVWTILIAVAALIALVIFLLVRYIPPAVPPPSSRWPGPMHFTIPVLSPFTSVIEHETSAVNVQLVAVLLLAAGIALVVWLKCSCMIRR
ncbi:hypothetical protein C8Q74DRAFT_973469 [Fomes fomentarius]|nr:hypothetical protein C8Q74DRAFT_973469 [Fomes fomentarius]